MSSGAYLAGVAFGLPTLTAALVAAALIVRRRLPHLHGSTRVLATSIAFTAALIACGALPAALGILTRGTSLLCAMLMLGAVLLVPTAPGTVEDKRLTPPPSSTGSVVIAAIAVAAIGGYELMHLATVVASPVTEVDLLTFHLPGIARFVQTGTLWMVEQFMPGFATAQYPNNGDFVILATVLPWHSFAFARLPVVGYYCLTGAAVWRLAIELGASRATATTFSAMLLAVPDIAGFALEGLPDVVALSTIAIGLTFLLRNERTKRRSDLVLAGLALGLAFGTKWYGVTSVAVVIAVWAVRLALARFRSARQRLVAWGRAARSWLSDTALVLGAILAGGGFWLLRNLIESGDPLYPKAISIFGVQLFAGSRGDVVDRLGYTIANYLGDPGILRRDVYPAFKVLVGFGGLVLLAGVVLAGALGYTSRRHERRGGERADGLAGSPVRPGTLLMLTAITIGICVVYAITPGSAYGPHGAPIYTFVDVRWVMPALVVAAALCASAATLTGRGGLVLELAALIGIADGIRRAPGLRPTPALIAIAVAATVAGVVVLTWRSAGARRRLRTAPGAACVIAATLAIVLFAGFFDQRSYQRAGYGRYDPVFAWVEQHAPTGARIALTGNATSGLGDVLPLFGPRLGNVVVYVGDHVRHSVELPSSERSFALELRRGRFGLLVIGLGDAGSTVAWAERAGYRPVVRSSNLELFAAPA